MTDTAARLFFIYYYFSTSLLNALNEVNTLQAAHLLLQNSVNNVANIIQAAHVLLQNALNKVVNTLHVAAFFLIVCRNCDVTEGGWPAGNLTCRLAEARVFLCCDFDVR